MTLIIVIGFLSLFCGNPEKDGPVRSLLRLVGLGVCGIALAGWFIFAVLGLLFG
jgi:hypothetical protein